MKFLIVLALASTSTVTAFDLRGVEIESRTNVVPEKRITNGNTALEGQFPYQVGLFMVYSDYYAEWCGGSLIAREWILTTASCIYGFKHATVYLGSSGTRGSAELVLTITENNFIIHSRFDLKYDNDIGLIKIPAVTLSSKIQIVKLPAIANSYDNYVNYYGIATGWGMVSDNNYHFANTLQWGRMKVISNKLCKADYGSRVTDSTICVATSDGVSPCDGDDGGPLVLEYSGEQIGIVSFGSHYGCEKGYPIGFVRLTSYLDWIYANTGIYY